jgi:hypothetical protein
LNVQNLRTFHLDASTRWSGPTRWSNPTAPAVRYPRTASATLCRVRGCWHAEARVGAARRRPAIKPLAGLRRSGATVWACWPETFARGPLPPCDTPAPRPLRCAEFEAAGTLWPASERPRRRPAIKPARRLAPRRRYRLGCRRRLPRFSGFSVRYNLAALRPATSPAHPLRCPYLLPH